jgi:hypothetical protein
MYLNYGIGAKNITHQPQTQIPYRTQMNRFHEVHGKYFMRRFETPRRIK